MEHASARGSRAKVDLAVLFIDLDRFKRVNDMHGQQVGDALLVAVGDRLSQLLRPADTLARLSGDEFVVLCEDLAAPSDAKALAERVATAMVQPFRLPDVTVHITAALASPSPGTASTFPAGCYATRTGRSTNPSFGGSTASLSEPRPCSAGPTRPAGTSTPVTWWLSPSTSV